MWNAKAQLLSMLTAKKRRAITMRRESGMFGRLSAIGLHDGVFEEESWEGSAKRVVRRN